MVSEDVPADGVGLSAGKAGHDGLEVAAHDARRPVSCLGALVEAVGCAGFHDHELGWARGEEVREVAHHSACERAHAGLHEHVRGARDLEGTQLLGGLRGHGAVALHDPARDLLVAIPGGVLHDHAVLGLGGLGGGHAHAVVVVDVLDRDLGALLGDVVEPRLRRALGHVHDGLLVQLVCRPGDAAAVVAVGGREKGGLTEVGAELVAREVVVGHLGDVLAHLLGDVARHGKRAAQHLEGVEAKAVALVLDEEAAEAKSGGHAVKPGERRHRVLGKPPMERLRLADVLEAHDRQVGVVAPRHLVGDPLNLLAHVRDLLGSTSCVCPGQVPDTRGTCPAHPIPCAACVSRVCPGRFQADKLTVRLPNKKFVIPFVQQGARVRKS